MDEHGGLLNVRSYDDQSNDRTEDDMTQIKQPLGPGDIKKHAVRLHNLCRM